MMRTDQAVTQLNFKVQEQERGVIEMGNKVAERLKEIQQEMQKKQPAESPGDAPRGAWVGGSGAAYGPSYYDMATPAKEATAPQTPGAAARAPDGASEWQRKYAADAPSWAPGCHGGVRANWQQEGQQGAPPQAPTDGFDPWRRGPSAPAWQSSPNPGGHANPWPQPVGNWPVLRHGSPANAKFFDNKFGQDVRNQYDGGIKNGEHWKAAIRSYFIGVYPTMKYVLTWAEKRGNNQITPGLWSR